MANCSMLFNLIKSKAKFAKLRDSVLKYSIAYLYSLCRQMWEFTGGPLWFLWAPLDLLVYSFYWCHYVQYSLITWFYFPKEIK